MLFFREICLERDVRLKGDTQEVHWSIQGFMEEIKISLAEFFFFFGGYCFEKLCVHDNFCITIFK